MLARKITAEGKCSRNCCYFPECGGFRDNKNRCPSWTQDRPLRKESTDKNKHKERRDKKMENRMEGLDAELEETLVSFTKGFHYAYSGNPLHEAERLCYAIDHTFQINMDWTTAKELIEKATQ